MTLEEAQTVGAIIAGADGGCPVCVQNLISDLNAAKLGFVWSYSADDDDTDNRVTVQPV